MKILSQAGALGQAGLAPTRLKASNAARFFSPQTRRCTRGARLCSVQGPHSVLSPVSPLARSVSVLVLGGIRQDLGPAAAHSSKGMARRRLEVHSLANRLLRSRHVKWRACLGLDPAVAWISPWLGSCLGLDLAWLGSCRGLDLAWLGSFSSVTCG